MDKDEKRLAMRAARRRAKEAALAQKIEAIRVKEHRAGFEKGRAQGADAVRMQVRHEAGHLYELGLDTEADAVRKLYRKLTP